MARLSVTAGRSASKKFSHPPLPCETVLIERIGRVGPAYPSSGETLGMRASSMSPSRWGRAAHLAAWPFRGAEQLVPEVDACRHPAIWRRNLGTRHLIIHPERARALAGFAVAAYWHRIIQGQVRISQANPFANSRQDH